MSKCVARLNSPNPKARKAGIASLGVVAEGCQEKLTGILGEVVPHVLRLGQDADQAVRECTCFCLGQLAEHCQPDILDYSDVILPVIFRLLEDNSENVQTTSCYVLEMFCESLDPESVLPFLNPLMTRLAFMLQNAKKKSVTEVRKRALSPSTTSPLALATPATSSRSLRSCCSARAVPLAPSARPARSVAPLANSTR
jgi:importin-4